MSATTSPTPQSPTPVEVASYKRFLITVVLVFGLSFGAIWIFTWKMPMVYLDPAYPMWVAKKKLLDDKQTGTVVILGDSAPMNDLVVPRMGPDIYNFALPGRGPADALHIAKQIVASGNLPKAVVLSFGSHHLITSELFWIESVGFGTLGVSEVEELRRKSRLWNDTSLFEGRSPFDLDVHLKSILYSIHWPTYYYPPLKATLQGGSRYGMNKKVYQSTLEEHGHAFIGPSAGPDLAVGLKAFVPSRVADDCLQQVVELFKERNIPIFFVSMPRDEKWLVQYDPNFKKGFTDYIESYATRYPNFHIVGEIFPSYPREQFIDALHLNKTTSVEWTDRVSKLLNDANVPGGPFGPRSP